MCGRYTHLYTWSQLHRLMRLISSSPRLDLGLRYNVAPMQEAPVVRAVWSGQGEECGREATLMRWGLVPHWAKDLSFGNRCINARAEEAGAKPAFRAALRSRRCLVPASGFYEWQVMEGRREKLPWYFTPRGSPLFAFAGLWEVWGNTETGRVETFTILTHAANKAVSPVHHRMPMVIRPEHYGRWLEGEVTGPAELAEAMAPLSAAEMERRMVSTRVNSVRNEGPGLIEEAGEEREEGGLWG